MTEHHLPLPTSQINDSAVHRPIADVASVKLDNNQVFKPALLQYESRNGGEERANEAIEGPPVVLQDEATEYNEATQGVVDEHNLGSSTQNPVEQLQQEKLFWMRETEQRR